MDANLNEKLLTAIVDIQRMCLCHGEADTIFEAMLDKVLEITDSRFGFMGEVLSSAEGTPFLKTHALTNIAWNEETRALHEQSRANGLEFHNLDTLFGAALKTGEPVFANDPAHDERAAGLPVGHPALTSFLCLPVHDGRKMVGLIGLANKPGGYKQADVELLGPILASCATLIEVFKGRQELGRLDRELRINRDAWEALFENSTNLVTILSPDHRILRANRAMLEKTRLSTEAITGRKCYEIIHGTDKPPANCPLVSLLRTGGGHQVRQMEIESLSGTFMVSCTPLFDEQGNIERIIHVATDITPMKEEESLRRSLLESRVAILEQGISCSPEELLTVVLDRIGELVQSPIGFYHFVSEDEKALSLQSWSSRTLKEFCRAEGRNLHYPVEQAGVWADALRLRRPVTHNDYESMENRKGMPPGHARVVRELVVPVFREDRVVAILGVGNKPTDYTQKDIEIVSYLADVTWNAIERIQSAIQLSKSREENAFLAELLHKAPVIAAFHDREQNIMWANQAYEEVTGKLLDQIKGKKCYDVWNLAKPCQGCPVSMAVSSGTVCQAELTPQNQDHWPESQGYWLCSGAPVMNAEGEIIGAIETAFNITERKKTEQKLLRLNAAIEQISEAIVVTDTDGVIQYVNNAFTELTGYNREEVQNRTPAFLKSGQQDDSFYQELWSTIKSGRTFKGRLVNRRKDGSLYTEEMSIGPVRDRQGRIVNFVAVKRDITDHLAMTQRLRQAQKMEAIGTLAGGIAHDFNNILSAILGFADIVAGELDDPVKAREDLEEVLLAGKRAAELVRQILVVARQSEQKKQKLGMQFIIKEALKLLRPSFSSHIAIETDIDMDTPEVMADPGEIHQVVMNLCINAKHAMEAIQKNDHRLKIGLRAIPLDAREVELLALPAAPGLFSVLTVSDTGCGMDEETMGKIFEPYFTTKEKGEGTGLGLATVHSLVTGCGGTVTVESKPVTGTQFTVYLPVCTGNTHVASDPEQAEIRGGAERIMVLDDEKPIVKLMERYLSGYGYSVSAFSDSQEAMQAFMSAPSEYDLIITDMNMPRIMGVDFAQACLKVRPELPILLCTGFGGKINQEKARAIGIRELVYKPVDMKRLPALVRSILDSDTGLKGG